MIQATPDVMFRDLDPWVRKSFLHDSQPVNERYADLFKYFIAGFLAYQDGSGARAHYPGAGSTHGRSIDGLEGFSRISPLIASWLAGGRSHIISTPNFDRVDLVHLLTEGIKVGTDPSSIHYWGHIVEDDQRVVEAADIALSIWLTKDILWPGLNEEERDNIVKWLKQVQGKVTTAQATNWRLFPIIVSCVLKALGENVSEESLYTEWSFIKNRYAGNGWFGDSNDNGFDYYNAWSFHYGLYWISQIDTEFESNFIKDARRKFVSTYKYLITPDGLPIFGRSICYRMASPTPYLIASLTDMDLVPAGQAKRALDVIWRYFVERGALANGGITQGYCGVDLRIVERYSGPASCLWGVRSLVIAFSQGNNSPIWTATELPLPIETSDFEITESTLRWVIEGRAADNSVMVRWLERSGDSQLESYTWKRRLAEMIFGRPFRPPNRLAKSQRSHYSSKVPFCGCNSTQPI